MQQLTKSEKTKAKFACLSLAILIMSTSTVGVALGDMAIAFPDVPTTTVQLVIGLPGLTGMPMALIGIPIAQRISCKKLLIIIQFVFVISGCSVFFLTNFTWILVMRAIMGVAKGMYTPILIATISYLFHDNERAQVLGFRNAVTMAGGALFSFVGGYLALIGWQYVYLIYIIGVPVALIAMFCLPNVKLPKVEKKKERQRIPLNQKVNYAVVVTACKALLLIIAVNASAANLSMHVFETGIGDSSGTGIANALMMGAGMVSGIIVGKLFVKCRKYTVTIGIAGQAVGLFLTGIAPNIVIVVIGQIIIGFALACYEPILQTLMTRAANPKYIIVAIGIYSFCQNFGQFISPYLITPFGNTTTRFLIATGMTVFTLIFDLFTNRLKWYGTEEPADILRSREIYEESYELAL